MSGITTGVGVFSGINSGQIIDQLLALESRPRVQFQSRIAQLQIQQGAFLDLNSKLIALKSSVETIRQNKVFQSKAATSSNKDVLTATVGATAIAGNYTFLVDRLVTSQQNLSRGFTDQNSSAIGATSVSFETARARLDTDTLLSELNDGAGVTRGKISVTDAAGRNATVDLSRAVTVQEVLDAINNNGTASVTASVRNGKFVIRDTSGGGGGTTAATVANLNGSTTADSLGLTSSSTTSGATRTGGLVYGLNAGTSLRSLNDGNGVSIKPTTTDADFQFTINVDDAGTVSAVRVNLGDVWQGTTKVGGAVSTVGQVVTRINEALAAADVQDMTASIDKTNGRIVLTDATGLRTIEVAENSTGTTAANLGLKTTAPQTGVVNGRRVLASMNTTLARGLNGGAGVTGDGVLNFTARDGAAFTVNLGSLENKSIQDVADAIESASGNSGRIKVSLNSRGTGLLITDTTSGTSNLIVRGTNGTDTAASLGISTGTGGVASSTLGGTNLQRQYISRSTLVSDLPAGKSLGTGRFRITDSTGGAAVVDIGDDTKNLGDLIDEINAKGLTAKARINTNGDGLEIYEEIPGGGSAGGIKIKVEDVSGSVAANLNLVGTASDVGASNKLNGTFERTVTLGATDTLETISNKINAAKVGVSTAVIRDGAGAASYRLSIASNTTGIAGRVIIDSAGTDLGLQTLDAGRDARVFFGSSDPAAGVVVTSSTNTIDTLLPGVKIDLKSTSADPITLSVTKDDEGIETAVKAFITTFNSLTDRIDSLTRYDSEAKRRSALTGDSTANALRAELYSLVQGSSVGENGTFSSLFEIGIKVGAGGDLEMDDAKFRAAMARDPESVEKLFTTRTQVDNRTTQISPGISVRNTNPREEFSALGAAVRLEQLARKYFDSVDGVLTLKGRDLTTQIDAQNRRITALDARLENRRLVLQRQFAAMEQSIAKMQSQQSALGSIGQAG